MSQTSPRRDYQTSILDWVALHGVATRSQVIWRYWIYRGLGPSSGCEVVRKMIERGLLGAERLDDRAGARSDTVLWVTGKGYRALGRPAIARRRTTREQLHVRLQATEVALTRGLLGWRYIPATNPREGLYALLLGQRARAARGEDCGRWWDVSVRDPYRVDYMPHVPVLWNPKDRAARMVWPLGTRNELRQRLCPADSARHLKFLAPVEIEMISVDPIIRRDAIDWLDRWVVGRHEKYALHACPSFLAREHPLEERASGYNRYIRAGLSDPLDPMLPVLEVPPRAVESIADWAKRRVARELRASEMQAAAAR